MAETSEKQVILKVDHLVKYFPITHGIVFQRHTGDVHAVDDVSFEVRSGETLGLVGESGCGKSTTGRTILQLYKPTSGHVFFCDKDLVGMSGADLRRNRRKMQMIFQDPYASLNPRMTVQDIIGEPMIVHNTHKGAALKDRVVELLEKVGLNPAFIKRYPHEFSGGQRQRIGIARALALDPKLVICDEAVSALDVSVQAQILNLLEDLQKELGLTYIFVSHDLSVVEYVADRVAVMYVGKLVEVADTHQLFSAPRHPYTEALLSAVPKPNPRAKSKRIMLEGDVADPANPPSGCYFHPRCRYAKDACKTDDPVLTDTGDGHMSACHFAKELSLAGVQVAG
jgi:oligopeptide transport system ATP-binding protein